MSCVGSDTALLWRLTAPGGEALGLSCAINLHVSVIFAAHGDILATFDPMEAKHDLQCPLDKHRSIGAVELISPTSRIRSPLPMTQSHKSLLAIFDF
jgi:hypothetical protein